MRSARQKLCFSFQNILDVDVDVDVGVEKILQMPYSTPMKATKKLVPSQNKQELFSQELGKFSGPSSSNPDWADPGLVKVFDCC